MKRRIRNTRTEHKAIKDAQRAMGRRPGVSPSCFFGLAYSLAIIGGVVIFGMICYAIFKEIF